MQHGVRAKKLKIPQLLHAQRQARPQHLVENLLKNSVLTKTGPGRQSVMGTGATHFFQQTCETVEFDKTLAASVAHRTTSVKKLHANKCTTTVQ